MIDLTEFGEMSTAFNTKDLILKIKSLEYIPERSNQCFSTNSIHTGLFVTSHPYIGLHVQIYTLNMYSNA